MKAFKAFTKPFEAPQRNVKIKIQANFFSLPGIGTERVNVLCLNYPTEGQWFLSLPSENIRSERNIGLNVKIKDFTPKSIDIAPVCQVDSDRNLLTLLLCPSC